MRILQMTLKLKSNLRKKKKKSNVNKQQILKKNEKKSLCNLRCFEVKQSTTHLEISREYFNSFNKRRFK